MRAVIICIICALICYIAKTHIDLLYTVDYLEDRVVRLYEEVIELRKINK